MERWNEDVGVGGGDERTIGRWYEGTIGRREEKIPESELGVVS